MLPRFERTQRSVILDGQGIRRTGMVCRRWVRERCAALSAEERLMGHSELDTEFLTSPRLILAVMLAVSCLLALGAELFSFSWRVVSTTMLLVIVLASVTALVTILVDRSPSVA